MATEIEQKSGPDLKPVIRILGWFTLCYSSSLIAYLGTSQGLWFWYVSLRRPAWNPPGWSVTPVWTILYGLIGWAAWDIWNIPKGNQRSTGLGLFFTQMVLNAIWPWLYFNWHLAGLTSIFLIVQWLLACINLVAFWKTNPRSGQLMIPYVTWLAFTTLLTIVVGRLNA